MKRITKLLALVLTVALALSLAACGAPASSSAGEPAASAAGSTAASTTAPAQKQGTILWLSNLSSGLQYETTLAYAKAICEGLGYDFTVVYGDSFNDAAGNLTAVKNGMTDDVVGIIASQDGGIASIMEEFPNLYMVGYGTDMRSVFGGGENASVLQNEKFLGTIADGYADGTKTGRQYAEYVIEKGYQKVSTIMFPTFAYPNLGEAEAEFRKAIEEHNKTAAEKIEIVGDTLTLEFQPLADSYFLEDGNDDLDAVIAFCAGVQFVYPTMVTAIANGNCRADTKLVTGGFDDDEAIIAAIGEDATISFLAFSPSENPAHALVLLDNAITGNQYDDFKVECTDSYPYVIASKADIDNVMTKSMTGTGDPAKAQLSVEDVLQLCKRNNPDATYAQLISALHSDALSVQALADK